MAIDTPRAVRSFFYSGVTVGLRGVLVLTSFVLIARGAGSDALAVFGIVSFLWGVIYASAQNFGAQPLIDLRRLRKADIASARVLVLAIAVGLSLTIWLATPLFARLYGDFDGLGDGIRALVWMGPLSILGSVDFALAQRRLDFRRIAVLQTASVSLSCLLALTIAYRFDMALGLLSIQALNGPIFAGLHIAISRQKKRRRTSLAAPELASIVRIASIGRHLAFDGNLAVIVMQGPIVLLGLLLPAEQLSIFVVITRLIQLVSSQLGRITNMALLPMVRREVAVPERLRRAVMTASFFSNSLVAAPLIAMFAAPVLLLNLLRVPATGTTLAVLLLLLAKQIMDTAGNTVFITFRSVGRPDAGWKWSLLFSCLWVALFLLVWLFQLDLVQVAALMAATGALSFVAVAWLCRTIGLPLGDYMGFVAPVYGLAVLALLLARGVEALIAAAYGHPPVPEIASSALSLLLYAIAIVGTYFLRRHTISLSTP